MAKYDSDHTVYDASAMDDGGPARRKMSAGHYLATRISSLRPPMAKVENPLRIIALVNRQQWLFFLVSILYICAFENVNNSMANIE